MNKLSVVLLCLYVADPATFLASNSVLGPYFPLRAADLFTYGNRFVLLLINIVNTKILFEFLLQNYTEPEDALLRLCFSLLHTNDNIKLHFISANESP